MRIFDGLHVEMFQGLLCQLAGAPSPQTPQSPSRRAVFVPPPRSKRWAPRSAYMFAVATSVRDDLDSYFRSQVTDFRRPDSSTIRVYRNCVSVRVPRNATIASMSPSSSEGASPS